jgi:O-antigen/teichoic acid export membrane protein
MPDGGAAVPGMGTDPSLDPSGPNQPAPSSATAHGLLKHISIYTATSFGLRGLNFLLLALYSRFLLPADYGAVALAETAAMVVIAVATLGVDGALRRLYFDFKDGSVERRDCVATIFRIAGFSLLSFLLLATCIGVAADRLRPDVLGVRFYPYIALALLAAGATTFVDLRLGLWQVEHAPAKYARFSTFVSVTTAAAVVLLVVVFRYGAWGMLAGKALAAVVCMAVALILSRHWLGGSWRREYARQTLDFGIPLVPHQLLALGLVAADRFILQHYRSLTEVGIYSIAYALGMVTYLVTGAVMLAWSPTFYRLAKGDEQDRSLIDRLSTAILLSLVAIASFGTLIARDFTRLFLDARYSAAGEIVPWVIAGYVFHGVFSLMQLPAMQAKRTRSFFVISGVALVLNVALNLWWVPRWGMYGSAYATTAAYFAEAVIMFFIGNRLFKIRLAWGRLAAAAAFYALLLAVCEFAPAGVWYPAMGVAGFGALLVCGLALRPYFMKSALDARGGTA